jgi:hypothetical protein
MKSKEVLELRDKVMDVSVRGRPLSPKSKKKLNAEGIKLKDLEQKQLNKSQSLLIFKQYDFYDGGINFG